MQDNTNSPSNAYPKNAKKEKIPYANAPTQVIAGTDPIIHKTR